MKEIYKIYFAFYMVICLVFANINMVWGKDMIKEDVPNITSKAAVVVEQTTGRVLFEKNSKEKLKIASTTKVLTAIVAVENANIEDKVKISKKAALTGGSRVGLTAGSEVTLESLLYGLLLKSGNDCAVAIAEYVGGDTETFVKMMNSKAYEIGAKDTHCTNPHGLDTDENYSTALDIVKITCYAKNISVISKIMNTESINVNLGKTQKYLANTNRLLVSYKYCDGGKTGYTAIAGRCLVATATKEDLSIVAVVLGANTTDIRFNECKKILEYGFNNYKMVNVKDLINWYIAIPVVKGIKDMYIDKFEANIKLPLKEGEKEEIYLYENLVPILNAPVNKGKYIGEIGLCIGNEKLFFKEIYTKESILKKNVKDYFILGIKSMFQNEYIS